MKCTKCGGEMEEGVSKRSGIAGVMSKAFWTTKIKLLSDPDLRYIKTWRCKNYGFLESYAK